MLREFLNYSSMKLYFVTKYTPALHYLDNENGRTEDIIYLSLPVSFWTWIIIIFFPSIELKEQHRNKAYFKNNVGSSMWNIQNIIRKEMVFSTSYIKCVTQFLGYWKTLTPYFLFCKCQFKGLDKGISSLVFNNSHYLMSFNFLKKFHRIFSFS